MILFLFALNNLRHNYYSSREILCSLFLSQKLKFELPIYLTSSQNISLGIGHLPRGQPSFDPQHPICSQLCQQGILTGIRETKEYQKT